MSELVSQSLKDSVHDELTNEQLALKGWSQLKDVGIPHGSLFPYRKLLQ